MRHVLARLLPAIVVLLLAASGVLFAAGQTESNAADEPQELIVWVFRGMNVESQVEEWGAEHDVAIEMQVTARDDMMNNLTTVLAAGSGAPDVAAVGGPFIERFKQNPSHWYDFLDFGAADLKSNYVEWRWNQMFNQDGSFMMGLPTDIGPMAMAYRRDVFEEAGLPTDRDEVAEVVSSWAEFIDVGIQVREETGNALVNDLGVLLEVLLGQDQRNFFDANDNLIVESSPQVDRAWRVAVEAHRAGISANTDLWTAEWGAGLQNGDIAVQLMPAWMMGAIRSNAPDADGLWDVTLLPEGGGNWGGSMIGIPTQSDRPELAYELVSWLLSPEQQLRTFQIGGQFPSTPPVYDSPELVGFTDPYFNDAPVGQIYSEAALQIEGAYLGPNYQIVVSELIAAVGRMEDGQTPQESYEEAVAEIKRQLSR